MSGRDDRRARPCQRAREARLSRLPLQIFLSYRRSDSQSASRQLAEALRSRFGPERVFFDTRDLALGVEWRSEIVGRVGASDVVLAVIGPQWLAAADARGQRLLLHRAEEDVLRLEIETALLHRAVVIPVLVDDAEMPPREQLPRPFKPLADLQGHVLRHGAWDRDFEALAASLSELPERSSTADPAPQPAPPAPGEPRRTAAGSVGRRLAEGSVVTILGSGIHVVDRQAPWQDEAGLLPGTGELAGYLARRFELDSQLDDLPEVAQHVWLIEGRKPLHRALRDVLGNANGDPGAVCRLLAGFPGRLRELGRPPGQLIVTTNYDGALEQAFDAAHEPYDLAIFAAAGEHRGRFVHVPWWDPEGEGCSVIAVPNEYVELPIDEDGELERTVIVKIHGGVAELGPGGVQLPDNFVITEDDHINYLTQSPIESLIPLQVLNKLRESHFLFLGYSVKDWSLRVFLQRILGEQQLEARSWAVDPDGDILGREAWDHIHVDVVAEPLLEFLGALQGELDRLAGARLER
jgi:hypothetical protein